GRGAGMFHASVSKAGDHHHVVFGKWKRLREKVGQIIDPLFRDLLHLNSFRFSALQFGLAYVESRKARDIVDLAEWSGSECEEISADGLRFSECHPLRTTHPLNLFIRRIRNRGPVSRKT